MTNFNLIAPQGGRLCRRALHDGSALVGLLHLPIDFLPTEGVSYALQEKDGVLRLDPSPVSGPLEKGMQCWAVEDLLTRPIWNKTLTPEVMAVRFITALPRDNLWTVYGA